MQSEGWITPDGVLTPEHDAAQVKWGSRWRMPTYREEYDLINKCDWTWTTMNGVSGYLVRGRGDYISNSIFLPAAGGGKVTRLESVGSWVECWSSVPTDNNNAWHLICTSNYPSWGGNERYAGRSIRPVQGFAE